MLGRTNTSESWVGTRARVRPVPDENMSMRVAEPAANIWGKRSPVPWKWRFRV